MKSYPLELLTEDHVSRFLDRLAQRNPSRLIEIPAPLRSALQLGGTRSLRVAALQFLVLSKLPGLTLAEVSAYYDGQILLSTLVRRAIELNGCVQGDAALPRAAPRYTSVNEAPTEEEPLQLFGELTLI